MIETILGFLGSAAMRAVWGEVTHLFGKWQDNKQEISLLQAQKELEAQRHDNAMESLQVQSKIDLTKITYASQARLDELSAISDGKEIDGWAAAVAGNISGTNESFFGRLVDAWNRAIRPSAGTVALLLWILALSAQSWVTNEWDKALIGIIFGFYFADRSLAKRGK